MLQAESQPTATAFDLFKTVNNLTAQPLRSSSLRSLNFIFNTLISDFINI